MVDVAIHNILTPILAGIITIIILFKNMGNTKDGIIWWQLINILILICVIVASSVLEYKMKIMVFIISVTWLGSTIIQQLVETYKTTGGCDYTDMFSGNLMLSSGGYMDDNTLSRVIFVCLYLFITLMLMIVMLYKIDSQTPLLNFMSDNYKYIFIIILPVILVLFNEITILSPYGNDYSKYISSDMLFKKFITGDFNYGSGNSTDNNKYILRFITTVTFLIVMFIFFINYTTEGNISLFSNIFGVGGSNIPIYIMLFVLLFFNFTIESLFLQKCSYTANSSGAQGIQDFSCRISSYGGLVSLLFISYTVSVLYQIEGTRYKIFALLFMASLMFGWSQLFIRLKNKG
jgi:hypothetical protein